MCWAIILHTFFILCELRGEVLRAVTVKITSFWDGNLAKERKKKKEKKTKERKKKVTAMRCSG